MRDVVNDGHGSLVEAFRDPQAQCEDGFCVSLSA
jgi:hypothetical protein